MIWGIVHASWSLTGSKRMANFGMCPELEHFNCYIERLDRSFEAEISICKAHYIYEDVWSASFWFSKSSGWETCIYLKWLKWMTLYHEAVEILKMILPHLLERGFYPESWIVRWIQCTQNLEVKSALAKAFHNEMIDVYRIF